MTTKKAKTKTDSPFDFAQGKLFGNDNKEKQRRKQIALRRMTTKSKIDKGDSMEACQERQSG